MFPLSVNSFAELYSGSRVLLYIALSLANGGLFLFASLKFLLVLQQSNYRNGKYLGWAINPETPYMKRLMLLCLLGLLFFGVLNMCFTVVGYDVASYIGFASYLLFTSLYIKSESSVNVKVPLRKTKRLVRLSITYILVVAVVTFGFITLFNYLAFCIGDEVVALLRYAPLCLLPLAIPYLLGAANAVNKPFEELIKKHYVKIAAEKLASSSVVKIGITGSYAKTSVKEILATVLSQKYRVLATPESYNTPMGIAISVKKLDSTHDVFIAEMGARYKGDIKTLADIVKPTYAVITGINNQHLESFGSIENTMTTKYELVESLGENGKAFFSSDNDLTEKLFDRFDGEKYAAGINGGFVHAENVVTDERGTTFTLCIDGEKPAKCNTVLLGKHSVSNICLAAAVAYKLGLSVKEIALGINRIKSVGHRLELMPNNKNIVIIDDSYNSNVDGVKAAMEVLDTFHGRKIVLTPGLVELGRMENVANLEFGKVLAKHADLVYVIGKHNAEMLISGMLEAGMKKENIVLAKNLNKANAALNTILKEGDVVLFENDLPDNYN